MTTEPESPKKRPYQWGFFSAAGVILGLMIVGQFVGTIVEGLTGTRAEWTGRETLLAIVLAGFVASSVAFVVMQWDAVRRFFRTMQVGVTLVSLSLLAVFVGVLVPQIGNFEDSTERIPSIGDISDEVFQAYLHLPDERDPTLPPEQQGQAKLRAAEALKGLSQDQKDRIHKYREEYRAFRWAEGFFVYHLIHPYGIGMPESPGLPPPVVEGLDRYGRKYGREERDNREKQMKTAFSGREISNEIGGMIRKHETKFRFGFEVATRLHLNRTYKSHWFATLLGMLFVGVAFNTFKGTAQKWLSIQKVGYVTVHMGVMTLLVGGAISKSQTVRGIMHMEIGQEPTDVFLAYFDRDKPRGLPFLLGLDRFARRDWKTLQVVFPEEKFKSQPPEYTLWPGRKVDLDFAADEKGVDRPRIRLEVLSVHERATVPPVKFVESAPGEKGGFGPLATLTVASPNDGAAARGKEQSFSLVPGMPSRKLMYHPAIPARLMSDFSPDTSSARELVRSPDDGRIGWLAMRVAVEGDVEPQRVAIRVGDTVQAPGGYTIKVMRATPSFRFDQKSMKEIVDQRPITEVYPNNPAVIISIQPRDGSAAEERPILERIDYEEKEIQKFFRYGELTVNFQWDIWSAPGPERAVLHWGSARGPVLVRADGSETPVKPGEALPLPGDVQLVLNNALVDAHIDRERNIILDPEAPVIAGPHFDASFYSKDPTGVEVRVTSDPDTPAEKSETIVLASTDTSFANTWESPDKRFFLYYFLNDKAQPFEWRSVLSVWRKDAKGNLVQQDAGEEDDREIRVNDYFHYKGYRFFQTNADARFPTYSGIGVVYDPGIPIVLFGMYLTIIGTVLAFVVRPIVDAYGKRARAASAAQGVEP